MRKRLNGPRLQLEVPFQCQSNRFGVIALSRDFLRSPQQVIQFGLPMFLPRPFRRGEGPGEGSGSCVLSYGRTKTWGGKNALPLEAVVKRSRAAAVRLY